MTVLDRSPEGLEEVIEDLKDLLAENMELALLGSWSEWMNYTTCCRHGTIPASTECQVRFQYAGTVGVHVEVSYWASTRQGRQTKVVFFPDPHTWWFPVLEDEANARATREANDRPLKPF